MPSSRCAAAVAAVSLRITGSVVVADYLPTPCRTPSSCLNSLLNFLRDFIFQFSPFNDFQGLTGCLKNGVHSNFVNCANVWVTASGGGLSFLLQTFSSLMVSRKLRL